MILVGAILSIIYAYFWNKNMEKNIKYKERIYLKGEKKINRINIYKAIKKEKNANNEN
ncbi:MAG: hypothetical protein V4556_11285 [Bacteroidota bacterium]